MEFNEYQELAKSTAVYPNIGSNLWYPTLGLSGESGEVAEKVKKIYRDFGGKVSEEKRGEICKELGDVLWYVAAISSELGITLQQVATMNVVKLRNRQTSNTLHGSGDNR